jgi:hypothetical protein
MGTMKIVSSQFQARFVERAQARLVQVPSGEAEAVDSVTLSRGVPVQTAFAQAALALQAAAGGAGVAVLAALSQDVARSLINAEQEEQLAAGLHDAFESRFVPSDPKLEAAWQGVQAVTGSQNSAPQQVASPLVYAQADSRNLFVGSDALAGDLANPSVLTFTLAHEEGHRQHRDTAGAKGLEAFVEAAGEDPKLFKLAFGVLREGRHENERQADDFGARAAARLGCDPKPILEFLLPIPEDGEHPGGRERAVAVRRAMAEEGAILADGDWRKLLVHDPRQNSALAGLGTFHQDPGSWQPLHRDSLDELRGERVEYLRHNVRPGSLVVLDQFFLPKGSTFTHGQNVAATARSTGFAGPILELDTTYSLHESTIAKLEALEPVQQRLAQATTGEEVRAALRELSVLKRSYALQRTTESLQQLKEAGLRQSAVNISLGHNAADETRSLLQRTLVGEGDDAQAAGQALLGVLRGFSEDLESFIDPRPEVSGPERARVAANVASFFQETVSDGRWQAAKAAYDAAVLELESQGNSVVVAAGNEGDCAEFLRTWCLGQTPELPAGFENNDLSNSAVTVVGALEGGRRADYTSHDSEIDEYADGRAALGDEEKGTSFAAPRVAARLAAQLAS